MINKKKFDVYYESIKNNFLLDYLLFSNDIEKDLE